MTYYWAGLDYAKWILCACGAGLFLAMLPEPAGARRGWFKLAACCTLAAGMFSGGLAGVLFNHRAPHYSVDGWLTGVHVYGSRKGSHTDFRVVRPTGEAIALSINRTVRWVHNGDAVRVVYQGGSGAVLSLITLSGSYANSQVEGTTGGFGASVVIVASAILAGYGILDWFNDGKAIPAEPDNLPMPDGEVDSASMLNLSSRE